MIVSFDLFSFVNWATLTICAPLNFELDFGCFFIVRCFAVSKEGTGVDKDFNYRRRQGLQTSIWSPYDLLWVVRQL